jgi:hypothetical protein
MIRPAERFSVRTPPHEEDGPATGRHAAGGGRLLLVLAALALGVAIGGLAPTVDLSRARPWSSIAGHVEVLDATRVEPAAGR